jgi:palmitoyl-protein thioesterase
MNDNLEIFADSVRSNVHLQDGFHAVGFSQGNNLIRGYIAKYNQPTVHTFLSINGVNAGIGAVPYCRASPSKKLQQQPQEPSPDLMSMCDLLMEQASHRAYTEFAQQHSFQANYWRDPRPSMREKYQKYRCVYMCLICGPQR